jgi:hypothetical protein
VDKTHLTQFGRAMASLGIEMIPRAFATHQGRLPKELAVVGITSMQAANRYLREVYLPAFNAEFQRPALEPKTACVPCRLNSGQFISHTIPLQTKWPGASWSL